VLVKLVGLKKKLTSKSSPSPVFQVGQIEFPNELCDNRLCKDLSF